MFFFISKEILKTSNSTKIKNTSREILHDTIKNNYCEPEREIRLTIAALEH